MTFPNPPENMTTAVDLFSHANSLLGGFLGVGILIAVAVISFIGAKTASSEKAFGFSGFLTLLVAILLRFMQMINDMVMYIVVVAFAGIVLWLWFSRQQEAGM
jgi:hypothetical protein